MFNFDQPDMHDRPVITREASKHAYALSERLRQIFTPGARAVPVRKRKPSSQGNGRLRCCMHCLCQRLLWRARLTCACTPVAWNGSWMPGRAGPGGEVPRPPALCAACEWRSKASGGWESCRRRSGAIADEVACPARIRSSNILRCYHLIQKKHRLRRYDDIRTRCTLT